jgi:hypothetical protein
VKITSNLNPLPIGVCAPVQLTLFDPATRDVPRNRQGSRVTIADVDMSVTTPNGTAVVGQQVDPFHWSVCGCQGGAPGTVATITASYPSQTLAAASQVPGVTFQQTATVVLGDSKAPFNAAGCPPPGASVLASPTGTVAPASKQPQPAATVTALASGTGPATAVVPAVSAPASAASAATAAVAPPTDAVGGARTVVPFTGTETGRFDLPANDAASNETPLFTRAGAWQVNGRCRRGLIQLYFQNTGTAPVDVDGTLSRVLSVPSGSKISLLDSYGGGFYFLQIISGDGTRMQVSTFTVSMSITSSKVAPRCLFQWSVLGN